MIECARAIAIAVLGSMLSLALPASGDELKPELNYSI